MNRKWTITRKLYVSMGLLTVIFVIVASIAWTGINGVISDTKQMNDNQELAVMFHEKLADHLNWVCKLGEFISKKDGSELTLGDDDHKCAFGKWLYGDGRKMACAKIPELAPMLNSIENPHARLHGYISTIRDLNCYADITLPEIVANRQIDHLNWAQSIRDAFLKNETELTVQTDPSKCKLGKWLSTDSAKNAYANATGDSKAAWDNLHTYHEKLHKSAIAINDALQTGNADQTEARQIFTEQTLPALETVMADLDTIKTTAATAANNWREIETLYTQEVMPTLLTIRGDFEKTMDTMDSIVSTDQKELMAKAEFTSKLVGITSAIGITISIIMALLLARSVVNALKKVVTSLTREVGSMSASSGQINQASVALASSASEQAATLEETTASIEQMSSVTEATAQHASTMSNLFSEIRSSAEKSSTEQQRLDRAMNAINQSSEEISKIIKAIEEIAFQTNLLSLNAAVEAARAGEHGKGFAVVADEVRGLAQRAGEAARETTSLIQESVARAQEGSSVAEGFGEALKGIVDSVSSASSMIDEVTKASAQQAEGIRQVSDTVMMCDKATQEIASNSEESAASVEELDAQAKTIAKSARDLSEFIGLQDTR